MEPRIDAETTLNSAYGHPPEVYADPSPVAEFPQPLTPAPEFSWYQLRRLLGEIERALDTLDLELDWLERRIARGGPTLTIAQAIRILLTLEADWLGLSERFSLAAKSARYLETWIPVLVAREAAARERGLTPEFAAAERAFSYAAAADSEASRRYLRPRRSVARQYLPLRPVPASRITIPIRTDLDPERDRAFIREVEQALDTYWNRGPWRSASTANRAPELRLRWTFIAADARFANGAIDLAEHLRRFGADQAGLTTGALSTHVDGHVLVLGPGRIQPRTIAHELGHLFGFVDCYWRALHHHGWQGYRVLEWDNPAYPDELMCDNMRGTMNRAQW